MIDILRVIEDLPEGYAEDDAPALPGKPRKAGKGYEDHGARMRERHADPKFAAEHRERGRRHMKRMNADPEFTEKRLDALRSACSDPDVRARMSEAARRRWAKARGGA